MNHDLTPTISQYLDRHLLLLLLEFLEAHPPPAAQPADILRAKLDLLSGTNMVDFAADIYASLHSTEPPQYFSDRRERVLLVLRTLQDECDPLVRVIDNKPLLNQLIESKNFDVIHLRDNYGVAPSVVEALYEYAKFQFDCGNYAAAAEYLQVYRTLAGSANPERLFFALWGKLAADILISNWTAAMDDISALKDAIDASASQKSSFVLNPLQQLQHRTWLIHWSLFVFFNHPDGLPALTDLFFQDKYLNTIQTNCPHILRYLAAAVIINKNRRTQLKDLVRVIQQESYTYHDPLTEFIECLYVNFDFDGAQNMLQKCEDTIKNDFFLEGTLEPFLENARLIIFEIYCRIHQCIDIPMLADKLNMDHEQAEMWIVNLIRNAGLDAKIDSQQHQVLMGLVAPSIYEQVVDNTRGLIIRTNALVAALERGGGSAGSAGGAGAAGAQGGAQDGKGGKAWRNQPRNKDRAGGDSERSARGGRQGVRTSS